MCNSSNDICSNISASIWKRESTQEWVLELSGTINDTDFTSRHTEPLTTRLEDVAGLPSLYSMLNASTENPILLTMEDRSWLVDWCKGQIRSNELDSKTYYGSDTTPEAIDRNSARQDENRANVIKFNRLLKVFEGEAKTPSEIIENTPDGILLQRVKDEVGDALFDMQSGQTWLRAIKAAVREI